MFSAIKKEDENQWYDNFLTEEEKIKFRIPEEISESPYRFHSIFHKMTNKM